MSLLLGTPSDRWPLSRAVDALADSARRAGVPGLIWFAGVLYPSLNLSWDLVRSMLGAVQEATGIDLPGDAGTGQLLYLFLPGLVPSGVDGFWAGVGLLALSLPMLPVYSRLVVGLAKVCDPERVPDPPTDAPTAVVGAGSSRVEPGSAALRPRVARLRDAWRAGKGLGVTALGMWVILVGLLLGAMLFLIGPLVMIVRLFGLEGFSPLFVGLLLPVLFVLLLYTVVLQVVNQLALHSLAHNRRGIASALTHAWRLIRTSPWSAARATLVDFVLFLTVIAAVSVLGVVLFHVLLPLWAVAFFAIYGFAGVTRAGFWARSYRALGGLSAEDQIPGL